MKAHVTIKDLAKELDISPSTVSRALKDHPDISPETKQQVQELAKKWNYVPNLLAQGLRQSKTNSIGVIVPELVHFFFSTVISGIENVAYARGYNVILTQSAENYEREVIDTIAMRNSRVDGMIVSLSKNTEDYSHFKELIDEDMPMVFFDRVTDELKASQVIVDDYEGAFNAVELLISKGCEKIAHLAGPANLDISINRKQGYIDALTKYGIPVDEDLIVICEEGNYEEGKIKSSLLFRANPDIDAFFGVNDMAAIGSILAMQDLGIAIPEKVKVVGFSDWQLSALIKPRLTTVSQAGFEMGQASAEMLINQIESKGEAKVEKRIIATKLVERETT
jgi:LacI family transcriptional regulator